MTSSIAHFLNVRIRQLRAFNVHIVALQIETIPHLLTSTLSPLGLIPSSLNYTHLFQSPIFTELGGVDVTLQFSKVA